MSNRGADSAELVASVGRAAPCTEQQIAAARRTTAEHAADRAELADLLDMLGIGPDPAV